MATVKIRNLILGEGIPKICVPIVGTRKEEILEAAKNVMEHQPDLVEWRGDFLVNLMETEAVKEILIFLREILGDISLLFTIRTKAEGGEQELDLREYCRINQFVIASGLADAVDVEAFLQEDVVKELIDFAHTQNVKVIGSNHDFCKTPAEDEIVNRLCHMQHLGMDVAKIAVMPRDRRDLLTLLSATETMQREHGETPIITMSMSGMGVLSRLAGEVFGSALTFGMVGKASAPGQVPIEELRSILKGIHQYS